MTKLINGLYLLYYIIPNWVVFELVNFNMIIIHVMFGLTNTMKYMHIDMTHGE